MGSLISTAKKLTKKKQDISKIRRQSEREFQRAKSLSRKYTSSLNSLQKRVISSREQIEDIGHQLQQQHGYLLNDGPHQLLTQRHLSSRLNHASHHS